jgi:hypothetical protein
MLLRLGLSLLAFLLISQAQAQTQTIITSVFNVFDSQRSSRLLVLSGIDGRVYRLPRSEANLKLLQSMTGQIVRLTFTDNGKESLINQIAPVSPREVDTRTMDLNHFQYNQLRQFAPTDLQSYENVKEVFEGMLNDGDRRRSQCFKRAHMWSYDMWSNLGIFSQKIFIFYTQRYVQLDKDAKWWFHVAPMLVAGGVEYVMDGTFMKQPITVREWQEHFIKSNRITCPVIDHYASYEKNQWNRLCYLMKVPMYYFSPLDIEHRDYQGVLRNHWILEELQDARRAFKNFERTYEGLDTGKPTITY